MKVQVQKLHTLAGHSDCVYTLQGSSNTSTFFSGSGDGMVVAWDLTQPENGRLIAKVPNSVYALCHHRETDLLVAGQNYEGIHILDWKNNLEVNSLQLTKAAIFDIQAHEQSLLVATGEGKVLRVDMQKMMVIQDVHSAEQSARTIAVNDKRGEIAVGYSDNHIRVFSLEDLKLKFEWPAHTNSVFTVRYTPDSRFLISGARDARLKVWDTDNAYSQSDEVVAHLYAINHMDFSPDGKHFVTCSMDKSIKVWDSEKLKLLKVIDRARHAGHGTSVNKLLWTSYQDQLLSASDDRMISVWNIYFETPGL